MRHSPLPALTVLSSLCTLGACLLLPLGARAGTPAAPAMAMDGVLVDAGHMTLYTFDQDSAGSGKSSCNGPCAANWPPLLAPAGAAAQGDWTLVMREDGTAQWAYMGRPLYRWAKDQKPGDRTGDGVKGVWHLAKP
ncbi:hypothetical protein [Ideonella sp. B508-1]|uniref:COG4315 family predicted lipoprotein n=1 Tax=Ideonella sp. B508-1 TaxID=137716 RepID=UPI000348CECF|nr:hypothetical protein [Ideonella sp. B508-1]